MTEQERRLANLLQELTEGMSPLEKTLFLVKALREAYGGEWKIEAVDGGFAIQRAG